MNLYTAQKVAEKVIERLSPYCERIEIAGSIRRGMPTCNDIDVVAIPKMKVETDMLGAVVRDENLLWNFLTAMAAKGGNVSVKAGGQVAGKYIIMQLPRSQLDVYFATPETFATRLLCRTGSKDHNVWLCQRAEKFGGKWETYEGLRLHGEIVPAHSEADIYAALNLPFIEPANREKWWINSNVEGAS